MSTRQLDRALQPKSVALVGASDRADSRGRAVMGNIVASGFSGALHLVNPRHDTIEGRVCYPNLSALPEIPDLVMVITPKEHVARFVNEAADLGAPAVMVMTKDPTPGSDSLFEQVRAIAAPAASAFSGRTAA